jgi:hypothetical protein
VGLIPITAGVTGVVAILVWGEATHWRASRRRLGDGRSVGGREAVVVLGYRNRGERANYVNRYRVRAGLRSPDPGATESVLVLCGGAVGGDVPEADLLERYARELGYAGPVLLDPRSRSTWENIQNAIPLIEDADTIKVVSSSVHAEKGRAYLWRLRPDLASRLRRGEDHRVGEVTFVKPAAAVVGLRNLRRRQSADGA